MTLIKRTYFLRHPARRGFPTNEWPGGMFPTLPVLPVNGQPWQRQQRFSCFALRYKFTLRPIAVCIFTIIVRRSLHSSFISVFPIENPRTCVISILLVFLHSRIRYLRLFYLCNPTLFDLWSYGHCCCYDGACTLRGNGQGRGDVFHVRSGDELFFSLFDLSQIGREAAGSAVDDQVHGRGEFHIRPSRVVSFMWCEIYWLQRLQ